MFLKIKSVFTRSLQLVICLSCVTIELVNAEETDHWQDRQYIYDSFLKIALQREYATSAKPRLVRWTKPILLYFESELGDPKLQARLLSVHAQHLSQITGVPIYFSSNQSNANIIVSFTSREK